MIQLTNITDEAYQVHTIQINNNEVTLTLKYHPVIEIWVIDVDYADKSVKGIKLSLGTLHLRSNNFPFDFIVIDQLNTGLDPYRINDFIDERCILVMLEPSDMEERRGYAVQQ